MDSGHHQRSRTTLGLSESSHYRERPLNLITIAQRDPSRLSEDLPSETGRPRSSCADTTDTHTFAEDNSAIRGKFGQSTCACRIEDKSEPKRAAGFPFVQPFESPAATTNSTRAGEKMRWSWLWITGDSSSAHVRRHPPRLIARGFQLSSTSARPRMTSRHNTSTKRKPHCLARLFSPILLSFPLHCWRFRVFDLHPILGTVAASRRPGPSRISAKSGRFRLGADMARRSCWSINNPIRIPHKADFV
jgi:hypothetical protein